MSSQTRGVAVWLEGVALPSCQLAEIRHFTMMRLSLLSMQVVCAFDAENRSLDNDLA
jgi:hypothetical protein